MVSISKACRLKQSKVFFSFVHRSNSFVYSLLAVTRLKKIARWKKRKIQIVERRFSILIVSFTSSMFLFQVSFPSYLKQNDHQFFFYYDSILFSLLVNWSAKSHRLLEESGCIVTYISVHPFSLSYQTHYNSYYTHPYLIHALFNATTTEEEALSTKTMSYRLVSKYRYDLYVKRSLKLRRANVNSNVLGLHWNAGKTSDILRA